jgi:hypothetical protein
MDRVLPKSDGPNEVGEKRQEVDGKRGIDNSNVDNSPKCLKRENGHDTKASKKAGGEDNGAGENACGGKRRGREQSAEDKAVSKRLCKEKQDEETFLLGQAMLDSSVSPDHKSFAELLQKMKVPLLKILCDKNNQMRSGSKKQLVWRVLAVKMYGHAGLCPKCNGGINRANSLQVSFDGLKPQTLICKHTTCKGRCKYAQEITAGNQAALLRKTLAVPEQSDFDALRHFT